MPDIQELQADEVEYGGYTYRVKGDGRTEIIPAEGEQALVFNNAMNAKVWIDENPGSATPPPTLTSLDPAEAPIQSGDITIQIHGTGFTNETILVWNGADDHAAFINETQMSTVVKTSLATVPSFCSVAVRNGDKISNTLEFSLTEAEEGESTTEEERTFPIGPLTISLVEDHPDGIAVTLDTVADVQVEDSVLIEATGNTNVNGTYTVLEVLESSVLVDNNYTLETTIENKGRLTVIA